MLRAVDYGLGRLDLNIGAGSLNTSPCLKQLGALICSSAVVKRQGSLGRWRPAWWMSCKAIDAFNVFVEQADAHFLCNSQPQYAPCAGCCRPLLAFLNAWGNWMESCSEGERAPRLFAAELGQRAAQSIESHRPESAAPSG